nr:hypothetical protein [uncultured Oscillibacter sp.]
MVSREREAALLSLWWSETEEDCTQEWRDELRGEELALVESWDQRYSSGAYQLCLDILQGNGV